MTDPYITIYHVSDIHVGEAGVSIDELHAIFDKIEKWSKKNSKSILTITGDITTEGLREEYEGFLQAFEGFSLPRVIVPGNHDERNYGTAIFEELIGERYQTYQDETIALYAVDSAEPDNDAGHVGRSLYNQINDFFASAKDKLKIFALHHHLIPVPFTGREYNVVEDAGALLGLLDRTHCSLVLSGHRHVPWLWRLNDMALCSTGTLMSRRIRGAYSQVFSQVDIFNDQLLVSLHYKDGTSKKLATVPFLR